MNANWCPKCFRRYPMVKLRESEIPADVKADREVEQTLDKLAGQPWQCSCGATLHWAPQRPHLRSGLAVVTVSFLAWQLSVVAKADKSWQVIISLLVLIGMGIFYLRVFTKPGIEEIPPSTQKPRN